MRYVYALIYINVLIPAYLWNHALFLGINGAHSTWADVLIGNISGLADGLVAVVLIAMLMLFQLRLGLAALLAFVVSGLIAQILKRMLDMPRPSVVFDTVHILGDKLAFHSFPSGHATTAGVLACLALIRFQAKPWLAWGLFVLALLAAYGRVYSGAHFPLDVVVGFGIGLLSMTWANHVSSGWRISPWEENPWSWKLSGLFLMIAAATLAMGYRIQPSTAQSITLVVPIVALFTLSYVWKRRFTHER